MGTSIRLGAANVTQLEMMPKAPDVDITDTYEQKMEMLKQHESQLTWMKDHDGIDFAEFVSTCARYRGLQCGAGYAEAFTPCYAWPKVKAERYLP